MNSNNSPRVLIAPLDWGLGHATRCIPIVKALLASGCRVYIACDDVQKKLLSQEFSNVHFLFLRGYRIRYASSKRWFAIKILQQIPKILSAIRRENKWLKIMVKNHRVDLVISDNRYGLFYPAIPCIFITHQLAIQTPFPLLSRWVQWLSYRFINRFSQCWVPDYEDAINIAGALSHTRKLPRIPLTYIGPLLRFSKQIEEEIKYKWLMILSGPEPQRTLLEKQCLQTISLLPDKVLFVRGLPQSQSVLEVPKHCTVVNHLPTPDLEAAYAQSEYIISRSGYTTIMEIIAMEKKSILIPTPGQTEQEYLAKHLMKQRWCYVCNEPEHLFDSLKQALAFTYQLPKLPVVSLEDIIKKTIAMLSQ